MIVLRILYHKLIYGQIRYRKQNLLIKMFFQTKNITREGLIIDINCVKNF